MGRRKRERTGKRKTGIDDKMVFFVRRYSEPVFGSYFEYRVDKEVCNPNDPFKFYLKVGGITYLPKKQTNGKKFKSSAEKLLESQYFGSYVFYGQTDRKLRCLLYARRTLLPGEKLLGTSAPLHNIIPRPEGLRKNALVTGIKIQNSYMSNRRWTRYDLISKQDHKGFFEIYEKDNLNQLFSGTPIEEEVSPRVGIYVPANTSLLMVDSPRQNLYVDYCRGFVYTLFQEGSFICTDRPFTLVFYDEDEAEEYDMTRLFAQKTDRLKECPNLERLMNLRPGTGVRHAVIFLKSAPNRTFWTIRANRIRRNRELEVQLCLPSGGQFEDIMYWNEGIEEVRRRWDAKPWNKYIEPLILSPLIDPKDAPNLEPIDLDRDEPYPGLTIN